jgi:uncharacterized protein (DUF1684 family)
MSVRVRPNGAGTDRTVLAVATLAVAVTAAGALWLALLAAGGRPDYRTITVDTQAGLALQVDAVASDGGRLGLGVADPQGVTTFQELPDLGRSWRFSFSYGGQEVAAETVSGRELAGRGWAVQVPGTVTMELERQGYR